MKCPNCGSKVTEGSAFCENCGAKIPPKESKKKEKGSFCPFCGAWNEGDDRFCAECGRDLAEIEDEIQAVSYTHLYEGARYSVTALARKLLIEKHGWSENLHVNGWMYFIKDGISLSDLRDRIENTE